MRLPFSATDNKCRQGETSRPELHKQYLQTLSSHFRPHNRYFRECMKICLLHFRRVTILPSRDSEVLDDCLVHRLKVSRRCDSRQR